MIARLVLMYLRIECTCESNIKNFNQLPRQQSKNKQKHQATKLSPTRRNIQTPSHNIVPLKEGHSQSNTSFYPNIIHKDNRLALPFFLPYSYFTLTYLMLYESNVKNFTQQ